LRPCAIGGSGSSDINLHPHQDPAADLYAYAGLYADANGYTYASADGYPGADRYPNPGPANGHPSPSSAYQYAKTCTAHRYPPSTAAPADRASAVSLPDSEY